MGIRYICDVCKKDCDAKGGFTPIGYSVPSEFPLDEWATIIYTTPRQKQVEQQGPFRPVGGTTEGFLVCSQACAEKALDEIKDRLRSVFESL